MENSLSSLFSHEKPLKLVSTKQFKQYLREGAKNGQLDKLLTVIASGADVNMDLNEAYTINFIGKHLWNSDALGYRALHWAARYGRTEVINLLIQRGANINQPNDVGNAPLHVAIYYNQFQAANTLLALGADPNVTNNGNIIYQVYEETPLHYAVQYASEEMILLLRRYNADIKILDKKDRTPLQLAKDLGKDYLIKALTKDFKEVNDNNAEIKLSIEDLLKQAKLALKQHSISQAQIYYDEILQQNINNPEALIGKGHIARLQLEPTIAINYYDKVLSVVDNHLETSFNKGLAYIEAKDYFTAISLLKSIIQRYETELNIKNYNDLARYIQKHYDYLPPNIDLEDVASVMLNSQAKELDEINEDFSVLPPPPPPPPPFLSKASNKNTNHTVCSVKNLKEVKPNDNGKSINRSLSFLDELKKGGEDLKDKLKRTESNSTRQRKDSVQDEKNLLVALFNSDIFRKRQQHIQEQELKEKDRDEEVWSEEHSASNFMYPSNTNLS